MMVKVKVDVDDDDDDDDGNFSQAKRIGLRNGYISVAKERAERERLSRHYLGL